MNYWILPDTHFGHNKMKEEEYGGRPEGFEAKILKNISNSFNQDDVLIHLGDFCFYAEEFWHASFMRVVNGHRWLIRGNHDKKSTTWYLNNGWCFVADEIKLKIYGKVIVFSHRPIQDRDIFDINFHGHFHNTNHHPEEAVNEKHRCLFLEHDYKPFNLKTLVVG